MQVSSSKLLHMEIFVLLNVRYNVAAPAGMIGASNFFELSVAVAIALFGPTSPVALATIVGVLVEVPVMLTLVKIANNTTHWFPQPSAEIIKNKVITEGDV